MTDLGDDGPAGEVIGRVMFGETGWMREVVLHGDGRWTCGDSPGVAEGLNSESPALDESREGSRGRDLLIQAARKLKGMAWLGSRGSGDGGDPPGHRGG